MLLEQTYLDLIDQGINIQELYVYDYIVKENVFIDIDDTITETVRKIMRNYSTDPEQKSLEYHINSILYNFEGDEDWD